MQNRAQRPQNALASMRLRRENVEYVLLYGNWKEKKELEGGVWVLESARKSVVAEPTETSH